MPCTHKSYRKQRADLPRAGASMASSMAAAGVCLRSLDFCAAAPLSKCTFNRQRLAVARCTGGKQSSSGWHRGEIGVGVSIQHSSSRAGHERGLLRDSYVAAIAMDDVFSGGPSATQAPVAAQRSAEADVMGLLLQQRIVFLGHHMDDFVADAIVSQLLLLDAVDPTKDIRLFVNSPGGSISAAMGIYDAIQLCRADVSTVAFGLAASTAAIVLAGGSKGKRFAMPNTRVMMHQPLGGASGQAIDVEIQAKEIMYHKDNISRIISEITGRSLEQVSKDMDRDRYMSPVEAMEYGLIDGVIDKDAIILLAPNVERVKQRSVNSRALEDPRVFLNPEIPDDEIY